MEIAAEVCFWAGPEATVCVRRPLATATLAASSKASMFG
jgi:hypothetical protein